MAQEAKLAEDSKPKAPMPAPPKVKIGDRIKTSKGRTGVVKYIGEDDVIGMELDTYDGSVSNKHRKYFNAADGRGYMTRKQSVANIVLPASFFDENGDSEQEKTTKRLISRTRKKLREIKVLEFKHKSRVVLHPNQIAKMNRKDELTAKLESLKNGTWNKKGQTEPPNRMSLREKVRIMARRTSIDWTNKYADKEVIPVEVDDAVRVANGGTGVVKYVGPIDFLGDDKTVNGILMDQWHPSYGNGTIDGKVYFKSEEGRGNFAHPPEIVENLGSTKPKPKPTANVPKDEPKVGQEVTLKDGRKGVVQYVGVPGFSEEKMIGVELDTWSTNTNSGTVNDTEYFSSNPGRGYFARFQSISDWKIPSELIEEAKQLDNDDKPESDDDPIDSAQHEDGREIAVNIGDRIISTRGYTGVVRFKGGVHFDEREVIGIELDQWSPNGHDGIIHGHKYFTCTDGRGYFIRKMAWKRFGECNGENMKGYYVWNDL